MQPPKRSNRLPYGVCARHACICIAANSIESALLIGVHTRICPSASTGFQAAFVLASEEKSNRSVASSVESELRQFLFWSESNSRHRRELDKEQETAPEQDRSLPAQWTEFEDTFSTDSSSFHSTNGKFVGCRVCQCVYNCSGMWWSLIARVLCAFRFGAPLVITVIWRFGEKYSNRFNRITAS